MDVSDIEKRITEAVQSRSSDFRKQSDSLTFEGVRRLLEKDMGLESFTLDAHKQLIRQLLEENFYSSEDEEVSASLKDVENDIENANLGNNSGSPKSLREGPETENNGRETEADGEGQSGLNKEITETEDPDQLETNQAEPPKVEIDTKGKGDLSLAENEAIIKEAVLKRAAYLKARADSITLGGVRRLLEQDLQLEKKSLDVHKTLISSLVDQVFGNLSGIQDDVKEPKKKQLKKAPKGKDNDLLKKDVKTKKIDGLEDSVESTEISRDDEAMEETSETLKGIKAGKRRKGEGFGNKPLKGKKRKKEPESEEDRKKVKKVAKKRKAVEGDDVEPLKPVSTTRKGVEDEDTDEEPVRHGISDDSGNDSVDEKVVKVQGKKIAGTTVAHGEQVEHLKKIIKSCGMTVPPAVYKKVKQAPESKREVSLIQELEAILKREGLSSNPTDKEIRAVKARKEREKDLEGIDMTNIISESRGRRATSNFFFQPPSYKVSGEGDEDSEDEENSETSQDEDPVIEGEEESD